MIVVLICCGGCMAKLEDVSSNLYDGIKFLMSIHCASVKEKKWK